jgi:hypothetical protein
LFCGQLNEKLKFLKYCASYTQEQSEPGSREAEQEVHEEDALLLEIKRLRER